MTAGVLEPSSVRADVERQVHETAEQALALVQAQPRALRDVVARLVAAGVHDEDVISKALLDLLAAGRVDLDDERVLHAL
jgi:hypothetical protein